MITETGQHPYPFVADAFQTGQKHGREGRYSLAQSTYAESPKAWVYWYGQGRATTAENRGAR